ncbi:MAG TPA: hypothetical protein VKY71_08020, partial [Actinotalea caeni]|nr:hypothetical protein [Actinotalea caeni]
PDAADVVRAAARLDVGLTDMRRYQVEPAPTSRRLVLGYGNLVDARLEEAVVRLAAVAGPGAAGLTSARGSRRGG